MHFLKYERGKCKFSMKIMAKIPYSINLDGLDIS